MDQEYINTGKGDWKVFQKRKLLKEDEAFGGSDVHPDAPIAGGKFDSQDDFLRTFGKNIADLSKNPEYQKILKAEKAKKDKTMYKVYHDFAREATKDLSNVSVSGDTNIILELLNSYRDEMAEMSVEAVASANNHVDEFNKLVAEAVRKRGIGLGIDYLGYPNIDNTDGFRNFVINSKEGRGALLPYLLPEVAGKLGVANKGTLTEAPNLFGRIQDNGRERKNVVDADPNKSQIPERVSSFASWMKNNKDYNYWNQLVDLSAKIFNDVRIANIYGAFASGFKKRQEIIKGLDTKAQNELLKKIASGDTWLLDPDDPALGFDQETKKVIHHDFKPKHNNVKVAADKPADIEQDDEEPVEDDEQIKEQSPVHAGVGRMDCGPKIDFYEQVTTDDRKKSKLKKINEGWNAYQKMNKGKKITGEGDKFNVILG